MKPISSEVFYPKATVKETSELRNDDEGKPKLRNKRKWRQHTAKRRISLQSPTTFKKYMNAITILISDENGFIDIS
jgi:hypothetical protein